MIGQKNLLDTIERQIKENTFPRFSILCGPRGSGKKLIASEISKFLNSEIVFVEPKVDNVREMISTAYKVAIPTLYVLADADNMSPAAKNAILKVTEEPPNNAYFVMTLISTENTLSTIRSRAQVYYIDPYSIEELESYFDEMYSTVAEEKSLVLTICENAGEIQKFMSTNVFDFYSFVEKVVDNIADVSISNAFKIDQSIAFKDGDSGYDLILFYKIFISICLERLQDADVMDCLKYANGIEITGKALQSLKNVSLNKMYAFDMWILNIREEWI